MARAKRPSVRAAREQYMEFARDKAFVDVTGHQGNDFQITKEFWAELNEIIGEFNEPGRFVTLPGYEWSGQHLPRWRPERVLHDRGPPHLSFLSRTHQRSRAI